jgi:hypothetical protein
MTFALQRHRPATVPSGPGIVARSQAPTTPAGSQSHKTQISLGIFMKENQGRKFKNKITNDCLNS